MSKINLWGFEITAKSTTDVANEIIARCQKGERTAVFTPNAEMLERALRSPDFARILASADLLVADGVGVCLAARLLGGRALPRVCGVDLGLALAYAAEAWGLGVYLLGGEPGVAERASRALRRRCPRLRVVGARHGYFAAEESEGILGEIDRVAPDIIFVCLGSPKQEKWIAENLPRLSRPCAALGLGGSLDVYAGSTRRAPAIVGRVGLEWLWRVICQPSRAARLSANFSFAARVLVLALKRNVQTAQTKTAKISSLGKK